MPITNRKPIEDIDGFKILDDYKKREVKRQEASIGDKFKAGFEVAKESNFIAKGIEMLDEAFEDDTQDINYTSLLKSKDDTSIIDGVKKEYGLLLSPDEVSDLKKTNNKQEESRFVNKIIDKQKESEFIQNTLTENQVMGFGITGAVLDADLLLGFGAGILAKSAMVGKIPVVGSSASSRIIGSTLALESAGVVYKDAVDEDYDKRTDGLIDLGLGLIIGTPMAKYSYDAIGRNFDKAKEDAVSNPVNINGTEFRPRTSEEIKFKFEAYASGKFDTIKKTTDKKAEKTFYSYNSNHDGFMDFYKQRKSEEAIEINNKEELSEEDLQFKKLLDEEEANLKVIERDELAKQKEVELQAKVRQEERDWYDEQFSKPKYAEENVDKKLEQIKINDNRKEFFKHQDDIQSRILNNELGKINVALKDIDDIAKTLKKKIKDTNAKLKNTKAKNVISRYKNTIAKLNDELKANKSDRRMKENELSMDINYKKAKQLEEDAFREESIINGIALNVKKYHDDLTDTLNGIKLEKNPVVRKQLASELEEFINAAKKAYPKEFDDAIALYNNIIKKDYKSTTLNLKSLSRKQKLGIVAVGLLAPALVQASEGEDDSLPIGSIIIAAVLMKAGYAPMKQFIKSTQMRQDTIKKIKEFGEGLTDQQNIQSYANSKEGNKILNFIESLTKKIQGTVFNRLEEIRKLNDPIANKYASDLLYDPLSGDSPIEAAVNTSKADISSILNSIHDAETAWNKTNGISQSNQSSLLFRRQLTTLIEKGQKSGIKEVDNAIDNINKMKRKKVDQAVEVKVKNANEVKANIDDSYMTRVWKVSNLAHIISKLDKTQLKEFTDNLADIIKIDDGKVKNDGGLILTSKNTDKRQARAKAFVSWFSDSKNFNNKSSNDIMNRLEEHLAEGVTEKDISEALSTKGDTASRLKNRVNMDMSLWKDMTVNIEGKEVKITLDDLVERDAQVLMDKYIKDMNVSIHFADKDYPTVNAMRTEIDNFVKNPKAKQYLHEAIDAITGVKPENISSEANEFFEVFKTVAFVSKLKLVVFSMITEQVKVIANGGIGNTLKNILPSIKLANKSTWKYKAIAENSGLATHRIRGQADYRGFGTGDLYEEELTTWYGQTSRYISHKAARGFGLTGYSDMLQGTTAVNSMEQFAKLVNNKPHTLSSTRLESYGINDETIAMFKDDFKFDSNGDLLDFTDRIDSWNFKKSNAWSNILFKINQEVTPETMLGTTGRLTDNTLFGRMIGFLAKYGMNVFSAQWAKDIHFRDKRSLSNTALTFGGSYIALAARYEATGREYTHEDLIFYSLMNVPALGGLSAAISMSSGGEAITSSVSDAKEVIKQLGNVESE